MVMRRKRFSIEESSGTTWAPSKKNAIEEIKRLQDSGKRKIVVRELVKKGDNFREGKIVSIPKLLKKKK